MTNLQAAKIIQKYNALKTTTIMIGAMGNIWSTYIGYLLGIENYFWALSLLGLYTLVCIIDNYIWFWVLEKMQIIEEVSKLARRGKSKPLTLADKVRLFYCSFKNTMMEMGTRFTF
jgi:hypothetical protein